MDSKPPLPPNISSKCAKVRNSSKSPVQYPPLKQKTTTTAHRKLKVAKNPPKNTVTPKTKPKHKKLSDKQQEAQ